MQLVLNPEEAFTKYALVKATGLRTPSVNSHLKALVELGWVEEHPFTPRTFQINLENKVVKQISELFQKLRYIEGNP